MSDRDELMASLGANTIEAYHPDFGYGRFFALDLVDVLLAEGWRKMPSREALRSAIAEYDDPASHDDGLLDAILALMGNPEPPISSTGEQ